MNGHVIQGTSIAVDFWQVKKHPGIKHFFLTHLHGDHIVGLTSSWRYPVYCSPLTAQLLSERYDVDRSLIQELEVGSTHLVCSGSDHHYGIPQKRSSSEIQDMVSNEKRRRSAFEGGDEKYVMCEDEESGAVEHTASSCLSVHDCGDCNLGSSENKDALFAPNFDNINSFEADGSISNEGYAPCYSSMCPTTCSNGKNSSQSFLQNTLGENRNFESFSVSVLHANHCPGAVMFLFEGHFGKILYTGDFRYRPDMVEEESLLARHFGTVDIVYLDNTYCSPECVFPSRHEALNEVISIARKHKEYDILIGLRGLGKEELVAAVGLALGEWVCVSPAMMSVVTALKFPNVFITARPDQRIRVVPFHSISANSMKAYNKIKQTIAILPSAIFMGIGGKPFSNQRDVFIVPYSDHTSYPELMEFVSKLKPASVVPIVSEKSRGPFGMSLASRADMSCFKKFLSKPLRKPGQRHCFTRNSFVGQRSDGILEHAVTKHSRSLRKRRVKKNRTAYKTRKVSMGVHYVSDDDLTPVTKSSCFIPENENAGSGTAGKNINNSADFEDTYKIITENGNCENGKSDESADDGGKQMPSPRKEVTCLKKLGCKIIDCRHSKHETSSRFSATISDSNLTQLSIMPDNVVSDARGNAPVLPFVSSEETVSFHHQPSLTTEASDSMSCSLRFFSIQDKKYTDNIEVLDPSKNGDHADLPHIFYSNEGSEHNAARKKEDPKLSLLCNKECGVSLQNKDNKHSITCKLGKPQGQHIVATISPEKLLKPRWRLARDTEHELKGWMNVNNLLIINPSLRRRLNSFRCIPVKDCTG